MTTEEKIYNKSILQVLKLGLKLVSKGWVQNVSEVKTGRKTCYCAYGALIHSTSKLGLDYKATDNALDELARDPRIKGGSVIGYNDFPRRTQAQIVALFNRSIARLEKRIA